MASGGDKDFLAKKIVSSDGPKGGEVTHDVSLNEWCLTRIEPEEESNRRRSVLERILNVVEVWIRHTMITEFRMPEAAAAQVKGRIFATGSYRYNVHTSGSDIDMVLIAPSRITREHFFNMLAPRLKGEPWVTDLHCIRESRVPIIAMVCDGIDIDLSFGSIRQDRVPEVITDDLLQGLDEQSVLSCNAVRVAHNIMDVVPNKSVFRQALRFVKAWGKARAIYSNTFGFPSGIGWAILTAFVCQCYPNQNAAGMVTRFFRTYHTWFKPNPHETGTENRAIYLTESMRARSHLGRGWDPRESKSDAMALFPVLTPAVPYGNACYNVTLTNLRQLCDEFQRGHELLSQYLGLSAVEAEARFGTFGVWSKVLEPAPFFGVYPHYLQIKVSCSDPELYQAYADGVESRMRILWAGNASSRGHTLEDYRQLRLHLNPRRFEDPEEVELRTRLTSKSGGASIAAVGGATRGSGARTSGQLNSDGHRHGPAGKDASNGHATGAASGSTWFTAHYFIGMTVDSKVSSAKIDLVPAIFTFHTVVKGLRQYRDGVTKLPVITVVDMNRIPDFVKEAAGYVEVPPDEVEVPKNADPATASTASGASSTGLATASSTSSPLPPGSTGTVGNGHGSAASYAATNATDGAESTAAGASAVSGASVGAQTATQSGDAEGALRKRGRAEAEGSEKSGTSARENGLPTSVPKAEMSVKAGGDANGGAAGDAGPLNPYDDDDDLEQALGLDF